MSDRLRTPARVAFVAYALVLFIATHKPGVDVNVVPGLRLDLFVHAVAFGLWTMLLGLTGWLGDVRTLHGTLAVLGVGVAYAVVDEASQAVPIFDRVFDVKDMLANAGGAALAVAVLGFVLRRLGTPRPEAVER